MNSKIKVAVFGAAGYAGEELLRLLLRILTAEFSLRYPRESLILKARTRSARRHESLERRRVLWQVNILR